MAKIRNIFLGIFSLAMLAGCFARSHVMTRQDFDNITLGSSYSQVEQQVGKPYSVKKLSDGSYEYLYIERIRMGEQVVEQNRYTIVVQNGQVISKQFNQKTPPAYDLINDDDPNDVEEE